MHVSTKSPNRSHLAQDHSAAHARAPFTHELRGRVQSAERLAYDVRSDEHGGSACEAHAADDACLYPEAVAAALLSHLVAAAEAQAGVAFERAVVSVPAYFTEEQCDATVAAGAHGPLLSSAPGINAIVQAAMPHANTCKQQADVSAPPRESGR